MHNTLNISSTAFENQDYLPIRYTGYGADQSPPLSVSGLAEGVKSLAIIMVDLDIPFIRAYPHWVIWNLPVCAEIPGAIPAGETPVGMDGARQGLGYGKHRYKGPRPPKFIRTPHRYVFTVYALDTILNLDGDTGRKALLKAMQGHILQQGAITGLYQNEH